MKGRIRIAAVGLVAMMAVTALTSTAGAASGGTSSISASGGFVGLSLLNVIGLAGGQSSAHAATGAPTTASGTGLCVTPSESASTCPNTVAASSADIINTTANASNSTAGTSVTAPKACVLPLDLGVVNVDVACGNATAGEDANGNPSNTIGEGNLAQVTVDLGSLPGLSGLLGAGNTLGSLCPAPSSSTSAPASTLPISSLTAPLSGLLNTVNSLLGGLNLPIVSTLAAPTGASGLLGPLCSILSGLTGNSGGLLGGLLNLTPTSPLLSVTVGDSTSTLNTTTVNGDTIETATGTTEAADVNLLGLLDIKVLPNQASIGLDTTTGQIVAPSVTASNDLLRITTGAAAPVNIPLPALQTLLTQVLSALDVGGVLNSLVNPQLNDVAAATTSVSPDGRSGTAEASLLKLNLLGGLVVLNLGDAKVAASSNPAVPAVITSPASTPVTPAAAPATPLPVVPGVTSVHTGEFWSGSLPIVLMSGMALAGLTMIGRRRIFSVARSIMLRRRS